MKDSLRVNVVTSSYVEMTKESILRAAEELLFTNSRITRDSKIVAGKLWKEAYDERLPDECLGEASQHDIDTVNAIATLRKAVYK